MCFWSLTHEDSEDTETNRPIVLGPLLEECSLGEMVRGMEGLAFSKLLEKSWSHKNHILPPMMLYPHQIFCSNCQSPFGQPLNWGFVLLVSFSRQGFSV